MSISKRLVTLMLGNMWVESEVSNGSKFFFTITSQISPLSMEATLTKMQPFQKRSILFVDTLFDRTGVVQRVLELGLRPYVVHSVAEVADKTTCPHIDTIIVDSLSVVRDICSWRSVEDGLLTGAGDRLRTCASMSTCGISPSSCCHQYVKSSSSSQLFSHRNWHL